MGSCRSWLLDLLVDPFVLLDCVPGERVACFLRSGGIEHVALNLPVARDAGDFSVGGPVLAGSLAVGRCAGRVCFEYDATVLDLAVQVGSDLDDCVFWVSSSDDRVVTVIRVETCQVE